MGLADEGQGDLVSLSILTPGIPLRDTGERENGSLDTSTYL